VCSVGGRGTRGAAAAGVPRQGFPTGLPGGRRRAALALAEGGGDAVTGGCCTG
jgi:hypothetical protein